MKTEELSLEKVEEFYRFLQGELPDGVHCKSPKLSSKQAFTVIWFLQEVTRALPDHYERCSICGDLYDSYCEGKHSDLEFKFFCDACYEESKTTRCDVCGKEIWKARTWREDEGVYLCTHCYKSRGGKR